MSMDIRKRKRNLREDEELNIMDSEVTRPKRRKKKEDDEDSDVDD